MTASREVHGMHLELHLSPNAELPAVFGHRINAAGGRYGAARGYVTCRTVVLPLAAEDLAIELIARYPGGIRNGTPVLGRATGYNAMVYHVTVRPGDERFHIARAVGFTFGETLRAALVAADEAYEHKREERAARPGLLRAERDELVFRLAAVNAELAELGEP